MNKVVHRQAPKSEPRANAINPSWVAQRGALVGNHATNTRYGITDPVKAVGVGGGRTVHSSGSQGQYGTNPGNPRPNPRRDALEQE